MAETDPTKDPKFQKVVQGFLRSPPKPHKVKAKKAVQARKAKAKPR